MDFDKFDEYVKKDENNREIEDATAIGVHENSGCADNYTIYLNISDDGKIEDSAYQTDGCPFGKATCEITTEIAEGLSLSDAEALETEDIEAAIDGYPPRRRTYPQQVLTAFRKALKNYDDELATPVDAPVEPLDDEAEMPQ
jgi:NifU-like protein involved in Fe-S cluster formation